MGSAFLSLKIIFLLLFLSLISSWCSWVFTCWTWILSSSPNNSHFNIPDQISRNWSCDLCVEGFDLYGVKFQRGFLLKYSLESIFSFSTKFWILCRGGNYKHSSIICFLNSRFFVLTFYMEFIDFILAENEVHNLDYISVLGIILVIH